MSEGKLTLLSAGSAASGATVGSSVIVADSSGADGGGWAVGAGVGSADGAGREGGVGEGRKSSCEVALARSAARRVMNAAPRKRMAMSAMSHMKRDDRTITSSLD